MISVLPDPETVASVAAERFVAAAEEAVGSRGRFVVVLAGGSTPRRLYKRLARPASLERVAWDRTVALFGDERTVGPDDPRSNYRMAMETLLERVEGRTTVHRLRGESPDLDEAASDYREVLEALYGDGARHPRFDLVLLGMGSDGHTASLFPKTAALSETSRWVVANRVPQLDTWRLTMTYPALAGARHVVFLITGNDKAGVVSEAFGGVPHDEPYPCERVVPVNGVLEILLDEAAAAALPE